MVDLTTPAIKEKIDLGMVANAIGLDSKGVPHVVYAGSSGGLFYATRGGSGWSSEPIEENFTPGDVARLAIDANDVAHVLYRDATTKKLEYARKDTSGWTSMQVEPTVDVNTRLDLALDPAGNPHAVFQNLSGPQHGYAHWTGSGFAAEAIPNSTGSGPSLVVDGSGTVYTTAGNSDASQFAVGTAGNFTVTSFDPTYGPYDQTDLAIDADGDLHLVYTLYTTRYYAKRTGSTWGTPVSISNVLNNAQIAVDASGNPYVVGYAGGGMPLYLGRFESGTWTTYKIANSGNAPSIVIDAQGKPHVSYYDTNIHEIWYATY